MFTATPFSCVSMYRGNSTHGSTDESKTPSDNEIVLKGESAGFDGNRVIPAAGNDAAAFLIGEGHASLKDTAAVKLLAV